MNLKKLADAAPGPYAFFRRDIYRMAKLYGLVVRSIKEQPGMYVAEVLSKTFGMFEIVTTEKTIDKCIIQVLNRYMSKDYKKQRLVISPPANFPTIYAQMRSTVAKKTEEGVFKPAFDKETWGSMEMPKNHKAPEPKKPQDPTASFQTLIKKSETATGFVSADLDKTSGYVAVEGIAHDKQGLLFDKKPMPKVVKDKVLEDLKTNLNPEGLVSLLTGKKVKLELYAPNWSIEQNRDGDYYLVSHPMYAFV